MDRAVAQFQTAHIIMHRWSLIRTSFQLHRVLEGIEHEPGAVLSTLVDHALREELEQFCVRLNLPIVHVLDPVMNMLQEYIGETAEHRPGRQYVMNADYFKRIDAMHYVLQHDDGQAQPGLAEADVILVGVSRSSKTPTCFFLANRGIKAANVPLVPQAGVPEGLESADCPVIGLAIDAQALIDIRRHRLRLIGAGAHTGGMRPPSRPVKPMVSIPISRAAWSARLMLADFPLVETPSAMSPARPSILSCCEKISEKS